MSATRLLVLGAVRALQPVHGYDVRRELLSWRLDDWVNTKTGSVYSALKTLQKDGLIAVTPSTSTAGRPERTEYVITPEGTQEFASLLRSSWWQVEQAANPLMPALCLMTAMPRAELIAALGARVRQLEARLDALRFVRASIADGATGADGEVPEHVREITDFASAHLRAELDWTRAFRRRLRAGAYRLVDEGGAGDDDATGTFTREDRQP